MKKFLSVLRHLRRNWPAIKKIIEMILRLLPFLLSPKWIIFGDPRQKMTPKAMKSKCRQKACKTTKNRLSGRFFIIFLHISKKKCIFAVGINFQTNLI